MRRLLLIVSATALLVAPSRAQVQRAPTENDITIPEFRQVFLDLGSYLDAHKGTNLRSKFEALPDETLRQMYPGVANPRHFQTLVATLRQNDPAGRVQKSAAKLRIESGANPLVVTPACGPPNSIIDDSSGSPCTPAYPDPTNNAWQTMVNPLITAGAFSPTDFADVSMQGCGLTSEVVLQQITVVLTGLEQSLTPACSIIPAPFNGICFGALIAVAVADSVSAGLFSDCVEQDGLVNAAKIDAGFHNTVTIFDALGTDFTSLNTALSTDFTSLNTALSTDFTNLTTTVNSDSATTDALITTDFMALTNQISQGTALLQAYLRQIMKLELTPDGRRVIDPPILTCTGTNCPNVLKMCPAAGCSWNSAGPLP